VQARYPALHILMCNAGITDPVRRVSVDGWELHVATCHLGHFLLTHLLLDLLKKSAPARIVSISSDAHKAGPGLDFDRDFELLPARGYVAHTHKLMMHPRIRPGPAACGTRDMKKRFTVPRGDRPPGHLLDGHTLLAVGKPAEGERRGPCPLSLRPPLVRGAGIPARGRSSFWT